MEAVHELFDAREVVPVVTIEDIDVSRTELLQAGLHGEFKRLGPVAHVVGFLLNGAVGKRHRKLLKEVSDK